MAAMATTPPAGSVVLVAPADSHRIGPHLRAAAALGLDAIVVTDGAVALPGSAHRVDLRAPQAAAERLAAEVPRPDAVVGTDTVALVLAAELARRWDLPRANSPAAAAATTDKARQRLLTRAAGVAQPPFAVVGPGDDAARAGMAVGFPAVVKPVGLTASSGVIRADDPLDVRAAADEVRGIVARWGGDPAGPVLVEALVEGGEVAVEALLDDGRLHLITVFDKPDPPQGPFFAETLLVAPARLHPDTVRTLADATVRVSRALGLRHGPLHAEFRIDRRGRPQFLELAGRTIGGRCAAVLRFPGGETVESLVLRQALGLPFDVTLEPGAFGVCMVPVPRAGVVRRVAGVDAAAAVLAVEAVTVDARPGMTVAGLPGDGRPAATIFARAATADVVEESLRRAWSMLQIELDADPYRFSGR